MSAGPIKVLVVDDSVITRQVLKKMLERDPEIVVAGFARNGEEALAVLDEIRPDVVTMDVEMSGIGGIEALRRIVARKGPPVIMVSALTQEGARTTLDALYLGAVDFLAKPAGARIDLGSLANELVAKVRVFGRRRTAPPGPTGARARWRPIAARTVDCIAIGTSTGGPVALWEILGALPADYPVPIAIVQHMPVGFTASLAHRLNGAIGLEVVEAVEGLPLAPGRAIIAKAGKDLLFRRAGGEVVAVLKSGSENAVHVPGVDVMFASLAQIYGRGAVAAILTGMGTDGVEGLRAVKAQGGHVFGQDEASSVVYGMPRAAAEAGLVDRVLALSEIAPALRSLAGLPLAEPVGGEPAAASGNPSSEHSESRDVSFDG